MKKGFSFGGIMVMLILIIFAFLLILIYFGPQGLIQKAGEESGGLLQYLPSVEEDTPSGKVEVSSEVKTAFNTLVSEIKGVQDKEGCFLRYSELPDLDEAKIEFQYLDDKTTARLYNENSQVVEKVDLPGMRPCVVAGVFTPIPGRMPMPSGESLTIAENFYYNFIEGNSRTRQVDYNPTTGVVLVGEERIIWGTETVRRNDERLIYVPEKGNFCFFPTVWDIYSCDFSINGLENSCFDEINVKLC